MARRGQRQNGARRPAARQRARALDNEGIIPVLARAVREVETAVQRGRVDGSTRTKFQVVALLVREERQRLKADTELTESQRGEELKRLDGIATILAKTAARDTSMLVLLAEDATMSDAARELKNEMLRAAGVELEPEPEPEPEPDPLGVPATQRVVPVSVRQRQLANPFLVPDFTVVPRYDGPRRLATLGAARPAVPLLRVRAARSSSCMALPEPAARCGCRPAWTLMQHQAQLVAAAARQGTARSCSPTSPASARPPRRCSPRGPPTRTRCWSSSPNVVKTNWAREAGIWTPERAVDRDPRRRRRHRRLRRHRGRQLRDPRPPRRLDGRPRLPRDGRRRGALHQEQVARSARSTCCTSRSRSAPRAARPLLMALTGTPLINDIEDFRAIWQFLGWIDDNEAAGRLMDALEETGLTPADPAFYPAARRCVDRHGHRARAARSTSPPTSRPAGSPTCRSSSTARSAARSATAEQRAGPSPGRALRDRARHPHVRHRSSTASTTRWSAGSRPGSARTRRRPRPARTSSRMMRRIGQAKAGLAADYAAQLARSVGKVVFFAKHIDVMDAAEETFARARHPLHLDPRRPDRRRPAQKNIDAFVNDPEVAVVVCSLTAAGVGLNLQVASNLVLAELSWTDAEQTQAIDRIHRIGQDEPGHRLADHRRADRSTPRSPSSSTARPASPPGRSTASDEDGRVLGRRPASRPWSACSPRPWRPARDSGHLFHPAE